MASSNRGWLSRPPRDPTFRHSRDPLEAAVPAAWHLVVPSAIVLCSHSCEQRRARFARVRAQTSMRLVRPRRTAMPCATQTPGASAHAARGEREGLCFFGGGGETGATKGCARDTRTRHQSRLGHTQSRGQTRRLCRSSATRIAPWTRRAPRSCTFRRFPRASALRPPNANAQAICGSYSSWALASLSLARGRNAVPPRQVGRRQESLQYGG